MRSTRKTDLESLVYAFLLKNGIGSGESLMVAFSGGPDSSCLLHILASLREKCGYSLSAAYIEHGIRPAAERTREADLVKLFCADRDLLLYIESIAEGLIVSTAAETGKSTEDVARNLRYKALRRLAREAGATRILLGHTLDDHLETLIMRFFQGSGERGLAGISPERGMLLRPFLTVEKAELLAYMRQNGVTYTEDSTNSTSLYLRNRVRSVLLPAIKEIFPGYKRALTVGAEKMSILSDFLKSMPALSGNGGGVVSGRQGLDTVAFNDMEPYARLTALYEMLSSFSPGVRIPFRSLRSLLYRTIPGKNGVLLSMKGVSIQIVDNRLFCAKDIVYNAKNSYFIVIEGEGDYSISRNLILTVRLEEKKKGNSWLHCSNADPPFLVRSRLPGDAFETAAGRKKLKCLFIDWHIPEYLKNVIPVIEDRKGIVFVLGKAFGYRDLTAERRIPSPERMTKQGEKGYTFSLTYMGAK